MPRTHELLLDRLLANLVDNAMLHGKPPVLIRLTADGRDAIVDVEDHGPATAPDAQARLTQAFARGDASRGTAGTGLGLRSCNRSCAAWARWPARPARPTASSTPASTTA